MPITEKLLLYDNLSSLICALYTLSGNSKLFKKLNLKGEILLCISKNDPFSSDLEKLNEFYKLLNSSSLRRFVFILLKPILDKSYFSFSSSKDNDIIKKKNYKEESILLKKYLRKFKYNYYYYFYYQTGNFGNLPTDREMNLSAIKLLFFIVGI